MMDHVRQLGVEIHFFLENNNKLVDIRQRIKILKSLEDYGFVRFGSKVNPFSYALNYIDNEEWLGYNLYEVVWYNSNLLRTDKK